MPIKIEVKLNPQLMTDFMIYHLYTSGAGSATLVLAMVNTGLAIAFIIRGSALYALFFFAFTLLLLVGFPKIIKRRVTKRMQRYTESNLTATYEFDETGITTVTADDSGKASWHAFKRAVSRKNLLILYDHKKQAIILPTEQMGEHYGAVVDLICEQMPASAVRIRRQDGRK